MRFQHAVRLFLRRLGYDLVRYRADEHPLARRARLLSRQRISLVLDVGANSGQYGRELRELGYRGRIVSFEPLAAAFGELQRSVRGDPAWETRNFALGDAPGRTEINVAANSYSSSLLGMLPAHLAAAPHSRYVGREAIEVRTLDAIFPSLARPEDRVHLKIDTQGFEKRVLAGAGASLASIATLQMELSLVRLYEGESLLGEMLAHAAGLGFELVALEPGFSDPESGRLLQVDALFQRL